MIVEPELGTHKMHVPSSGSDDDSVAFATGTPYFPYQPDGRCGQAAENSVLFTRSSAFLVDAIIVSPVASGQVILRDGNAHVQLDVTLAATGERGPIDLLQGAGPMLINGLPSLEVSSLSLKPTMLFRTLR